jgi:hypothetical protein
MKKLAELAIAIAVLAIPVTGSTQTLTEAQARAVIAPWYALFNQPVQGDMKTLQEQILTPDYESCWGYFRASAGAVTTPSESSVASPRRSQI